MTKSNTSIHVYVGLAGECETVGSGGRGTSNDAVESGALFRSRDLGDT